MQTLLSWEAPEYIEHKKSADWYWWLSLAAVGLLIFSAYERSLLFGVFVVMGWFTIMLYSARPAEIIRVSVSEQGMALGANLYPWTNIKSFWIFEKSYKKEISFELKRAFMPFLKVPLGNMEIPKVRETLLKFIHEKEQNESFIDNISDLVRF
ncbi:MAG: hypothetical protein AAB556_01215 [Patescibacteria group bacterium]